MISCGQEVLLVHWTELQKASKNGYKLCRRRLTGCAKQYLLWYFIAFPRIQHRSVHGWKPKVKKLELGAGPMLEKKRAQKACQNQCCEALQRKRAAVIRRFGSQRPKTHDSKQRKFSSKFFCQLPAAAIYGVTILAKSSLVQKPKNIIEQASFGGTKVISDGCAMAKLSKADWSSLQWAEPSDESQLSC